MTVLVGMLCQDGVVIGADTSSTSASASGIPTVEQPVHKISIISNRTLVACTGQIGLAQRFVAVVKKASEEGLFSNANTPIGIAKSLFAKGAKDFEETRLGPPLNFGALVAFPADRSLHLCEFATGSLQPELKDKSGLWYVSMGSGQAICDPFLGFQRRVFWRDGKPPNLRDGVFSAMWSLKHAVDVNPGGIKGPIEVATLVNTKGGAKAQFLEGDDLQEHHNNIEELEGYIGKYADALRGHTGADSLTEEVPVTPRQQS